MQFDFGKNWTNFAKKALDDTRVQQARAHFQDLVADITLTDRSFVDIGFGQGLSLFLAVEAGARVIGCDINRRCMDALRQTSDFFSRSEIDIPQFVIGSILDKETVDRLRDLGDIGGYDVVHSWGVLHHTGNMSLAISNAASLVKPGGILIIAIYNRHWSSAVWLMIKRLYCSVPSILQRFLIAIFFPIIWVAKLIITGRNPMTQERGMDFLYDIIDWVGGYPYEYADIQEVRAKLLELGFECRRVIPPTVPTGCNQFIFLRRR